MATRQADAGAYVKRAEAVGLRTEGGAGGVTKIYFPDGQMVPVHKTYGSAAALRSLDSDLKRLGLHKMEESMLNAKFTNGQERTARGRAAAEKKAKELEAHAQANAVAKASGPYLSQGEDILITWFAEPHPAPWMRWANITPEIAGYLLGNHNTLNRAIRDSQVDYYMAVIRSGQWHLTHQGMAMDTDGVLQDGQHRLQAIDLLSGEDLSGLPGEKYMDNGVVKICVPFFVGMDPSNFKAIDEGLLRTAAQLFGRSSEKNGSTLQTTVRLIIAYRSGTPRQQVRLRMPNQVIIDTFNTDPDGFRQAAQIGASYGRKCYTAPAVMAAGEYLLRKANGESNRFVDAFLEGIATGLKSGTRMILDDADPRNVFREQMQLNKEAHSKRDTGRTTTRKRLTGLDQLALLILSWNNMVNNYSPRVLKYSLDSDVPRIIVCKDEGNNASACPTALLGEIDGDEED